MLEKIMIWQLQPSTWFLAHLLHTWSNFDEGSGEVLPIQSDDLAEIPMDETDPLGSPTRALYMRIKLSYFIQ